MPTRKRKERKIKALVRRGLEAKTTEEQLERVTAERDQARAEVVRLAVKLDQQRMTNEEVQAELHRASDQFGKDAMSKDNAIEKLVGEVNLLREERDSALDENTALLESKRALSKKVADLSIQLAREQAETKSARAARKALAQQRADYSALLTRYHQVVQKYAPAAERRSLLHPIVVSAPAARADVIIETDAPSP